MAEPHADAPAPPATVLVVDDDAAMRRMLRLLLRDGGFEVDQAGDGREALDQVMAHCPDALVLDLEMPVMDGRSLFRELRARGFDVPVIVLSAYGSRSARRELGAEASLDKPFQAEDLLTAVRRLVA